MNSYIQVYVLVWQDDSELKCSRPNKQGQASEEIPFQTGLLEPDKPERDFKAERGGGASVVSLCVLAHTHTLRETGMTGAATTLVISATLHSEVTRSKVREARSSGEASPAGGHPDRRTPRALS